jgi:hypothetical protein
MARLTLIAALAMALLTGCGHTAHVGLRRWVQVALTEYRVTPQRVTARAGELAIVAHNDGRLTHNLALTESGHTVASTRPIPPGQDASLLVVVPPGRYVMASTLFSDEALGIYGTVTVTR